MITDRRDDEHQYLHDISEAQAATVAALARGTALGKTASTAELESAIEHLGHALKLAAEAH
jgi:hypothetical protein